MFTVTVTVLLVVVWFAVSRAVAVSVCSPLLAVAVFQETLYGLDVSSLPKLTPSSLNCTPATPVSSLALAVTETDPDTVALFAGADTDTTGGWSGGGSEPPDKRLASAFLVKTSTRESLDDDQGSSLSAQSIVPVLNVIDPVGAMYLVA